MNEKTEQNINEAIDWLQKTGGSIQDFAVEQAPLYCRELVAWELWSGIIYSSIGVILLIVGFVSLTKFIKWMKEDGGEPNSRNITSMVLALVGILVGLIATTIHLPRAIKAAVAPRLVIVEHLRNLKQ